MEYHARSFAIVVVALVVAASAEPQQLFSASASSISSPQKSVATATKVVTDSQGRHVITTVTSPSSGPPVIVRFASPASRAARAVADETFSPARPVIPVLRRNEVHDEAGQYALGFETGNGIIVEEQGALRRNLDGEWKDDVVLVKRGSYSYQAPDGRTYHVSYTADENGFHPSGKHFPVEPSPLTV